MGNSESSNPVRNLDKRTARREYKEDFVAGIQRFRRQYYQKHQGVEKFNYKFNVNDWEDNQIRVFARKRPIFQHEIDEGEYDVVTCFQNNIIIHDARMHTDMKRQFLNHHKFQFDTVFSETSSNQTVYETSTKPLVEIACDGGFSTALVYGQTGSGKTFTMSYIYAQAAEEIFNCLHKNVERFADQPVVSVSFIEIAGDHVHDLLNAFQPTQLRSAGDGSVHAYPVVEPRVSSKEELLAVIQHALNIRTTAATGVHDQSSRSHAVLKIYIQRNDKRIKGGNGREIVEGTLTLVDLAGSEHRIDSMYHGKERRKETSYINASLMALKECIRARATGTAHLHQHVYRKSKLTMALKNSFHLPSARTIVIATVSPASKDTEHSLNTLRHACIMQGQDNPGAGGDGEEGETRFVTGGKVTTEQIGEINIAKLARKNFEKKKVNGELDELKTSNGNNVESKLARAANKEIEITDKMKRKMRRMAETRSFTALDENIKQIILTARQKLGQDERQLGRIQLSNQFYQQEEEEDYPIRDAREGEDDEDEDDFHGKEHDDDAKEVEDDVDTFHSSLPKKVSSDELESRKPPKQQQQQSSRQSKQDLAAMYEDDFESSTPSTHDHTPPPAGVRPNINHKPISNAPAASSSSSQYHRVPYQKIYDSIFIAKDSVPMPILMMQLRAMLQVHNYSAEEIECFLTGRTPPVAAAPAAAVVSSAVKAAPTTPQPIQTPRSSATQQKRSTTPQRPSSASSRQSLSSATAADRPRSNSRSSLGGGSSSHQPPVTRTPVRSSSNSRLRSSISAPPENSDSDTATSRQQRSSALQVQSSSIQSTQSHQNHLNKEKEDKYLAAKLKVEQEAIQRKARQDAAKQIRSEMEKKKTDQIIAKNPSQLQSKRGGNTKQQQVILSDEENELIQIQKEIDYHSNEMNRLNEMLEADRMAKTTEEKLSMAQKFGVKKQIALHRAACLKAERKKVEKDNSIPPTSSSSSAPAPAAPSSSSTAGGGARQGAGYRSESEDSYRMSDHWEGQSQQQRSGSSGFRGDSRERDQQLQRDSQFQLAKREAPTVIETRGQSSRFQQQQLQQFHQQQQQQQPAPSQQPPSNNNQRYYGAASGGFGRSNTPPKKPGWNFDPSIASKLQSYYGGGAEGDEEAENRVTTGNGFGAGYDAEDLPIISEKGRPISTRLAQSLAQRR